MNSIRKQVFILILMSIFIIMKRVGAPKARTLGIPAPEEPTGRERPQVPSTGRPPGGPAAFRLPLPPAMWLRRPYDRDEYNPLRSMLGEIEADPLTPRDYFW